MLSVSPQFTTNKKGKISVTLNIKEFKTNTEELEELEDIRLYNNAKLSKEVSLPIDEAFKIIETNRKKKK